MPGTGAANAVVAPLLSRAGASARVRPLPPAPSCAPAPRPSTSQAQSPQRPQSSAILAPLHAVDQQSQQACGTLPRPWSLSPSAGGVDGEGRRGKLLYTPGDPEHRSKISCAAQLPLPPAPPPLLLLLQQLLLALLLLLLLLLLLALLLWLLLLALLLWLRLWLALLPLALPLALLLLPRSSQLEPGAALPQVELRGAPPSPPTPARAGESPRRVVPPHGPRQSPRRCKDDNAGALPSTADLQRSSTLAALPSTPRT